MWPWIMGLIAAVSTAVCLFLWFRDVRRNMRDRQSTVESAARQLSSCRSKVISAKDDPRAADVFERSKKIYVQAVELYNQTLEKAWVFLPARLMGFRHISKDEREEGKYEQ